MHLYSGHDGAPCLLLGTELCKNRHDRVSDELVDESSVFGDGGEGECKVGEEEVHELVDVHALAHASEVADVREENCDGATDGDTEADVFETWNEKRNEREIKERDMRENGKDSVGA